MGGGNMSIKFNQKEVPIVKLRPSEIPIAIPSKLECDKESPKYAIFFQTTKHPRPPPMTETHIPAMRALIIKPSSMLITFMSMIKIMFIQGHHVCKIMTK